MPDAAPAVIEDAYRKSPRLNWSRLKLLEKSPAHFQQGLTDDATASQGLGTACHMAILEPEKFAAEYIVTTVRRDERTKAWQEFQSEALRNGKSILSQSEMDRTLRIRDAVRKNKRADYYLSGGQAEVPLMWDFVGPDYRFECKGRADYVGPAAIVDLKTTQCASLKAFAGSCMKFGYYGQASFYSDGCAISTRQRRPFVFVAVESAPPFIVSVFTVSEKLIDYGRRQYTDLLGKLDYCTKRNWWGGYSEEEETELTLPHWATDEE